ncbi:MAG: hypothetical protein IAE95_08455 [Chitinophagaceae bacterium]|nr:hypothetical protein [Chitinophagaceae bacterium]
MAFYFGVALISFANLRFIDKINTFGIRDYFIYAYIVPEKMVDGATIWAIGNTFAFIGLRLFEKMSFPDISIVLKNKNAVKYVFRFVVVVIFLNMSGQAINLSFISGGLQKILVLLNLIGIMFFARLWVVENDVSYRNYALILLASQTTIALFTSYLRTDLMTPVVSFFGGYFLGKGSIKYVFSYRILPLVAIGFFFSLFFNALSGSRSNFISAFSDKKQSDLGYTYQSVKDDDRGGALDRSSNIAQLSNIVRLVERKGHYNGQASFPLLAALIPRALWPDKPNIELGAWFALEIGAATISPITGRANNSVNMTIPGELYLDFGWIGVILGGIFFGGLLAAFWNASSFNLSPFNLTGSLWGGYLLFNALFGLGSDLQLMISLVSTYLMLLVIKLTSNYL